MMKVSIITVVYNNKEHISDCLNSVLEQTYKNIEHIVIDGGSTDGTQEKIEPYKENLAYYISEKDNGMYNGLNKGIKKASGDIVGILHSDDIFYSKDTIELIVDAFSKSKADLIYANGLYVEGDRLDKVKRVYNSKSFKKRYLKFGWIPLHTTIYVKKEVFDEYGLYQENFKIASDYEISLRWFIKDSIKKYFLDKFVVKMRLGGKSTSMKLQKLKSSEDLSIIKSYKLLYGFTLYMKIVRKIPQYIFPLLFMRNK